MQAWRYRIVIEGELDELSASRFDDVDVEAAAGHTVLSTGETDQAGLDGLLDRLRHIGAPLVGVSREPAHPTG